MKQHPGVWSRYLAISMLAHVFVLATVSCFIPADFFSSRKEHSPYYLELELGGSGATQVGDVKLKDASPLQTVKSQTGKTLMERSALSTSVDSDSAEVRWDGRTGNGAGEGLGVGKVTDSGTGIGSGSGKGSRTGVGQAAGVGISRGPVLLSAERPDYPETARSRGLKGTVRLKIFVNQSGSTGEVQLISSSGFAELDETARLAVQNWRFRPALQNGQSVGAWVTMPIKFEMR